MKKIICLLAVITLMAAFLVTSAFAAEETAKIMVSDVNAVRGEEVRVEVSISNNPGFASTKITVEYDSTVLELVSIDVTGCLLANGFPVINNEKGVISFANTTNVTEDGVLMVVTFRVKADAAACEAAVKAELARLEDNVGAAVAYETIGGTVMMDHDWDDGTVTTEPTEESEGVKTYCCRRCDATYTETIPALDHVHDYVVVETVEPTCTEQGYTVYECRCGDSYKADFVDALGHDWDDGTVTTEPTEESEGVKTYCCRRCDATYTETIPALDHVHDYVAVETVEPTCTEQGYTVYECRCGDSYKADYVDALGHDMGEWTVVNEPTCTEEGLRQRTCSRCDYIETEAIPVIDHTHSDEWSSNATHHWHECTCGHKADMDKHTVVVVEDENGAKMEVCSICGYILGPAPTGDNAVMYIVAMLTSMLGLAMLLAKKKEF